MATKKTTVVYQGDAQTYMTRDPEFTFKKGNPCSPSAEVIALIKNEPGFVVAEEEIEDGAAFDAQPKVKVK